MDKCKNNKSLDDLDMKNMKKMLALAALVLFSMTFTSCKAKIGEAKAKVKKYFSSKEYLDFWAKRRIFKSERNTAQAAVSLKLLVKSLPEFGR